MAPVELVEASLRQGQQALLLSRLRLRHALPVARLLDGCGFAALDVFGGATFEASLRFLAENPFERLRAIREAAPRTPLLGVVSGRFPVGHGPVAGDVVDAFVRAAAAAGLDIFRCYDPLNDVRNLERCIAAVHEAGRIAEGVICYSDGSVDGLVEVAGRLAAAGCDRLCLWDPLGLPGAARASDLVRRVLERVPLPLGMALSAQTGQAGLAYWSGASAGATRVDVALSPLAGGASLPPAEAFIASTRDTELRTGLEVREVASASDALEAILPLYIDIHDPALARYDHSALRGLLPLSAMPHAMEELRRRDAMDRLEAVEREITRVRTELGYPPLITPIIEIIATQAVFNVLDGDRYATITEEVGHYCRGLYGQPPEPVDPSIRELVSSRALDVRPPSLEDARRGLAEAGVTDPDQEALVCYALFPDAYLALTRGEAQAEPLAEGGAGAGGAEGGAGAGGAAGGAGAGGAAGGAGGAGAAGAGGGAAGAAGAGGGAPVDVRTFVVEVDGQPYSVRVSGAGGGPVPDAGGGGAAAAPREGVVTAPMAGLIVRVHVAPGERVAKGDVVAVLEAMKMQNEITAPSSGMVAEVHVNEGAVVARDEPLLRIE